MIITVKKLKAIAINKYFESLRAEYEETTESIYDIANEHNAIIDELALRRPQTETTVQK